MSGPENQRTENCPTLQISRTEKCPDWELSVFLNSILKSIQSENAVKPGLTARFIKQSPATCYEVETLTGPEAKKIISVSLLYQIFYALKKINQPGNQ